MRGVPFVSWLLVGSIVLAITTAVTVVAQPKIPADFTFDQGKDSPGAVTFSHAKHRDAGLDKCQACHTKIFKMKKGQDAPLTMARMKSGELCGTCHNGKTDVAGKKPFTVDDRANCATCHKKA
jgi:c(7)-type cytochrome triheme protein